MHNADSARARRSTAACCRQGQCYFGRLEAFAQRARRALCDAALLVFTVEASNDDADYRLHAHGRYSHRPAYVTATLENAGFAVRELADVVLRNEGGLPVVGFVVVAETIPTSGIE
jgi:predicted TPR repeat methyltransferase